jgi:hypothetical protein
MDRLKVINETIINDKNKLIILENNIQQLKLMCKQLQLDDRRLKKLSYSMINPQNVKYNTQQIVDIQQKIVDNKKEIETINKTISTLENEIIKMNYKCIICVKENWMHCYRENNDITNISENKFKCNICSKILLCDCTDCFSDTKTFGTFIKLQKDYNIINDEQQNYIQENNNNILQLNKLLTQINDMNELLRILNKYPNLLNFDSEIIKEEINKLNVMAINLQSSIDDLTIKITNNKIKLKSFHEPFNKFCNHKRDSKLLTLFDGNEQEYKSTCCKVFFKCKCCQNILYKWTSCSRHDYD